METTYTLADGREALQCPTLVEDDRTGMSPETLKRAFLDNLFYLQGVNRTNASPYNYYVALAYTVHDRLLRRFLKSTDTYKQEKVKLVCYFSPNFSWGGI
ncbi:MAG UNVERIFIED_CONTAM: hypothetical protein LVR29_19985 [Microcystis novacekii LVE1205-3]|jgi:starch phosphorylase